MRDRLISRLVTAEKKIVELKDKSMKKIKTIKQREKNLKQEEISLKLWESFKVYSIPNWYTKRENIVGKTIGSNNCKYFSNLIIDDIKKEKETERTTQSIKM